MIPAKTILPPKLRRGDTIGLFCPAGPARSIERVDNGLKILTDFGFRFKFSGAYRDNGTYLADSDSNRAKNLRTLWEDDEVKAILAIRGGFGSMRLIPHLDLSLLRKKPKLLIGFSDVSALISGLVKQAKLVAVHGPVLTSLTGQNRGSIEHLLALLTGEGRDELRVPGIEILRKGTGVGQLIGGNLTTLVHLIGTPWEPDWDKTLLVLEDTGEHMYRLDRMLTHLAFSGRLNRLSGLILGRFDPGHDDRLETLRLQERVWERVLELTSHTTYPVWSNFPFGHQGENLAVPMGIEASMDSPTGSIRFHWKSVHTN